MTFTEAAVEVLRLVGKPLHYKKITEVAIERNLLSHVGKTPEVTMSSRLATMVKRDRGEAPIIKVKPGVFGLREFNEEQLADLSGDVDELPEVDVENESDKTLEARESSDEQPAATPSIEPRKPLPGADVFPEEEDDDEPILGGDDDEDDDEEGEEGASKEGQPAGESRSSRRRRKRRRRGAGDEPAEEQRPREAREERPREERVAREQPARNERRFERERSERSDRNDRNDRRRDRDRDRNRDRDDRREQPIDYSREPGDGDLLGKDLADAVASVLSQSGSGGQSAVRIAEQLVRKGRLAGDAEVLVPTVMAAVRADVARHRVQHTRPRFRIEGTYVTLTEFLLPQDVVRAEQDVTRAAERQRERARRAFLRKLSELPGAGLAELIATWLNAEGVVGLRAVRKPGGGVGELHLAGTLRRGAEEVRLAVVVYREARDLGREKVIEARGSLHYYGSASTAWLITFGNVLGGAREEASAPASDPVALFDGLALAAAMESRGVGLSVQSVPISVIDYELFEALRGPAPRERERDRDRDRDREYERRERPRLVLERPRPQQDDEVDAIEEAAEDGALDEGDEVVDAVLASEGNAEAGAEAGGEAGAGESNRRRRRRRRRRGRGNEATETEAAAAGEAGEEAEAGDVGEEWTAAAEPYEEERGVRDDDRSGSDSDDRDSLAPDQEREPSDDEDDDDEERSYDEPESNDDDERTDDERTDDERTDDERTDEERARDDEDDDDYRRGHG